MGIIRAWNHPKVTEVRGRGLMIGVDLVDEAAPVLRRALERGLLVLGAGPKTLRFLPPYVVTDGEIDEGLQILRDCL